MRRRNKTGGKAAKIQRRKKLAHRNMPEAASRSLARAKETNVGQLIRERDEALEQQAATSEILGVIRRSPTNAQPVFDAIVESASRLCEAVFSVVWRYDGGLLHYAASHDFTPELLDYVFKTFPKRPDHSVAAGRAILDGRIAHVPDLRADRAYAQEAALAGNWRASLAVPMLRDGKPLGVISVGKAEAVPFSERQMQLLSTFADQAVIAIENVRLFEAEQKRTRELSEALEQQTATSEVLKVISSSPGDLDPVFETMLANAVRICGAKFGNLFLCEADGLRAVAFHDAPQAYVEERRRNPVRHPTPATVLGRAMASRQPVQVPDIQTYEPDSIDAGPGTTGVKLAQLAGARTVLAVPMVKESELVGALTIYRQEVLPFTDKQVELVQNFAAQAVIAIENARLLKELRQRTDDLSEALEQQTATSEVLQVISSSAGELKPVFETMLESAVRICGAKFGNLLLVEGDAFRHVALHGAPQAYLEERRREPVIRPRPGSDLDRIRSTKQIVHVSDMQLGGPATAAIVELAGARTFLNVPMLKDNELIGTIGIYRQEVRPFTDKQIELVQNFAAQAVIAIENARLLNDLNKLNQQLEQRVDDQVNEIERMSRLRRFLPSQVADLIVASGTEKQLESHRREITALFCDLRGFTGFSESSDPEDVMALLREYHASIGEIINKYGGTLERYAGDGVMVVFNDPIPVDSPALQAVLMAIDMRAAIGDMIEKRRKLGHDIGFGIGIAHGFATLGTIGFEGRFDYAAIGTVSNVASRLCDEAKPGQILISPRVLMAVEGAISVEPVGEFKLKGISRPLTAYNVLSAVSAKI